MYIYIYTQQPPGMLPSKGHSFFDKGHCFQNPGLECWNTSQTWKKQCVACANEATNVGGCARVQALIPPGSFKEFLMFLKGQHAVDQTCGGRQILESVDIGVTF